jgi:RHS repeat-associated protein
MGQATTVTTQLNFVSRLCYDAGGRMTSLVDPRGSELCGQGGPFTWLYTYDPMDHLRTATNPLNNVTTFGYDADGNLTSRTDDANHVTRFEYNAANDLQCVLAPTTMSTTCASAPATSKTSYGYDYNDNVTSRTDGNSHQTAWGYDDANRLQTITSPANKSWGFAYWPNNLLKAETLPSLATIAYDYDVLGHMASVTYSNAPTTPNVTFQWDANGNRTQMTDGAGTVNYVYNDLNALFTTTRGTDVFTYQYYPAGELKQVTYPDGLYVGYQYDGDDRLCTATINGLTTSCTTPLSSTTSYGYDAANDLTTKGYPSTNGYVATLGYDNADRLMSVSNTRNSSTLSSFSFGSRDGVGNPNSLIALQNGSSSTTYYTYDALDRLTGACNLLNCSGSGLTGLGYTYDPVGNRLTRVAYGGSNPTTIYKYNSDDQLCWSLVGASSNGCSSPPGGSTAYAYDPNGNETSAGSWTYGYDSENRMISAQNGGTSGAYTYDGDGNRLSSVSGGTSRNYLWDTNGSLPLLAIERSGGSTLRDYEYGVDLNSMTAGGSNYFYQEDAFQSVADVTSSSGATECAYNYDAFGTDAGTTKVDPSAPANPMRFDGQLSDALTGLYYLRARVYDQAIGRFLQQDPARADASRPYAGSNIYSGDRPTVLSDPSGRSGIFGFFHTWWEDWKTGASELFEDWKAGPIAPKIIGGVLIVAGASGIVCLVVSPACAAALGAGASEIQNCLNAISGYTVHGLNQAISREGVGVSPRAILDATTNAEQIVQQSDGTIRYIGQDAVVILNEARELVTTWARNSNGWRVSPP